MDESTEDIAEQYLRKFAFSSGAEKTFGLREKDGKFYIWKKKEQIKENNIIFGDREYAGTPGLWKLIVATTPDDTIFTDGDYGNYAEIMHSANALRRNNDECETKPQQLEIEAHIKTKLGRKGSVRRRQSRTFGSLHHFTM